MTINLLAVLTGGIISVIFGAIWYSPKVFGNTWMRLSGIQNTDPNAGKGMWKLMFTQLIFSLFASYVLAYLISLQNITTISEALTLAFWLWLGIQTPLIIGPILWEKRPFKLFVINGLFNLLNLIIVAKILILIS